MQDAQLSELVEEISAPSPALVNQVGTWGNVIILGAGGKIGSGLSTMLALAFAAAGNTSSVLAVSRWNDETARAALAAGGVTTLRANAADPASLAALPDVDRVVFLVGAKFGTSSNPSEAWMANTVLPNAVASRFPDARIAALSTGNVYPFTPAFTGGPDETVHPSPVGEYAMSCLGRERVFQHAALTAGTLVSILRLNYACEPRYGVVADIARRVYGGEPVDVSVGAVNVVGQRYVNEVILRSLDFASSNVFTLNLVGPETASVRWIAGQLGNAFGREPVISGVEGGTSLLSNGARCHSLFGYPDVSLAQLIDKQVRWMQEGGELWAKPTKFERTDGKF